MYVHNLQKSFNYYILNVIRTWRVYCPHGHLQAHQPQQPSSNHPQKLQEAGEQTCTAKAFWGCQRSAFFLRDIVSQWSQRTDLPCATSQKSRRGTWAVFGSSLAGSDGKKRVNFSRKAGKDAWRKNWGVKNSSGLSGGRGNTRSGSSNLHLSLGESPSWNGDLHCPLNNRSQLAQPLLFRKGTKKQKVRSCLEHILNILDRSRIPLA